MNSFKRGILKILSGIASKIRDNYRIHRKLLNALNPYFKPAYRLLDYKIKADDREIPVRIFSPHSGSRLWNRLMGQNVRTREKGFSKGKVLIFFHGGGWVTGNIDSYTNVCVDLAKQTGSIVISVDYRLAPEHPFPAGLEDCYNAAREIFLNLSTVGFKSGDIALIGDSAGANLAAAVSLMARDRGEFLPERQILIYPATYNDHTENSPFPSVHENGYDYVLTAKQIQDYMQLYVQREEDRKSPYFAPLLAEDLSHQPKTLIITAEFDPLRDEGEAYGQRLKDFGNFVEIYRLKGALHGFFSLPWKSEHLAECYRIINGFLYNDENMSKDDDNHETEKKG